MAIEFVSRLLKFTTINICNLLSKKISWKHFEMEMREKFFSSQILKNVFCIMQYFIQRCCASYNIALKNISIKILKFILQKYQEVRTIHSGWSHFWNDFNICSFYCHNFLKFDSLLYFRALSMTSEKRSYYQNFTQKQTKKLGFSH